jgi:hypothetical protein
MTLRWPVPVLRPRDVAFDIAPRTLAGASSIAGARQVVSSSAGIWTATFANILVRDRDQVNAFRAIAAILEGRLNPVLVPFCRAYQPAIATADMALLDPVPHSDGAYFSDGTGYVGSASDITLTDGIAAGATSAAITINNAATLEPGQVFSIGERAYRIRSAIYASATVATVAFSPPAREAAAAGVQIEIDNPVIRMRLASDGEMDLMLDGRRRATPTVNFIEDL